MTALRVLHAIHDFLPRHRAGAEIYAAALCRALSHRHHVTVLAADYDLTATHGDLKWRVEDGLSVVEIVNNWEGSFADTYRSAVINRRLEQVLDVVRPQVLHVHSLLNLSFDLPALARRRGITVLGTLHDYTLVCASGGQRIHQAEQHLCREIDPERCARCFSQSVFQTKLAVGGAAASAPTPFARRAAALLRRGAPKLAWLAARTARAAAPVIRPVDISARLTAGRAALDEVSLFVSPSRSLAAEFQRLGVPPARMCVSDYGFESFAAAPRRPATDGRLRVAYVGTLVWHKGIHIILDAFQRLPVGAVELTIFGEPAVSPEYVATLQRQAVGLPVRFAGGFDDAQRAAVFAAIDVLIVPSLWLENSPLVIHEAFASGVAVIASRIGGISELIDDGVNGLLVSPGSAEDLAGALRKCVADPQLPARLASRAPSVRAIEQDAADWERRYRDALLAGAADAS